MEFKIGDRVRVINQDDNHGEAGYVEETIDVIGKSAYGVWFDDPNHGSWFYFANDLEPLTLAAGGDGDA